ncbi:MAG TPA: hypothetical protein VGA31_13260 [Thermoanaerobaculia bacterium]
MKTRVWMLLLAAAIGLSSCQTSRQSPPPPAPGPTSPGTGAPVAPNPNPAPPVPPPPTPLALNLPPPPAASPATPPLAAIVPDQPAIAVDAPSEPPARPYRDILKLKQEGLSDEFILKKVRTDNVNYQLTTAEILELRNAGISETILQAMLRSGQPATR